MINVTQLWVKVPNLVNRSSNLHLHVLIIVYNFCIWLKRITLCNCLCSSSCLSNSHVLILGTVNRYFWSRKSLNIADESGEFSTHVRIDIRIDISISSITPMTIKFPRQVYPWGVNSNKTNQAGAGDVSTSKSRDFEKMLKIPFNKGYGEITYNEELRSTNLHGLFCHVVLLDHVAN